MTYVHGLTESQAVTEAAQNLSDARERVEWLKAHKFAFSYSYDAQLADAKDKRTAARAAYDAAYKRYTNPFEVEKTFS